MEKNMSNKKNNSIQLRVSFKDKKILETAAKKKKQTLSAYILNVVKKQSLIDLETDYQYILNNNERNQFLKLLDNPPPANKALKELLHNKENLH